MKLQGTVATCKTRSTLYSTVTAIVRYDISRARSEGQDQDQHPDSTGGRVTTLAPLFPAIKVCFIRSQTETFFQLKLVAHQGSSPISFARPHNNLSAWPGQREGKGSGSSIHPSNHPSINSTYYRLPHHTQARQGKAEAAANPSFTPSLLHHVVLHCPTSLLFFHPHFSKVRSKNCHPIPEPA